MTIFRKRVYKNDCWRAARTLAKSKPFSTFLHHVFGSHVMTKAIRVLVRILIVPLVLAIAFTAGPSFAASINILALGASNTNGVGVGTSEAWPAQLERMLRAKGIDANVSVNAVNGQTSAGVLARASQIPSGTQVVVFDNGGDNDRKKGLSMAETNANVAGIIAAIRAHGAAPIRAPYRKVAGAMYSENGGYQHDGHHMSAQSHARVAASLVPMVLAAVRKHH
jgi:acyl-CoA thioesterase I